MTDPTPPPPTPAGDRGGGGPDDEPVEEVLSALGVPDDVIESARRHHTLALLAIEQTVMPDAVAYDIDELEAVTGMPAAQVVQLWRSLGFATPRPGERMFTQADAEMIRTVAELMEDGLIEADLAVQMSRVIGSSMARVAAAQVDAIALSENEVGLSGENFTRSTGALLPVMPRVMDYVWRRHLQVAARRRMMREGEESGDPRDQVVGFADLVGFTALSQQISSHELARVVDRFETIAYDTIGALDGRVVKMIGDEVMFIVDDERRAVEISITLAELYGADESLSDVRVGLSAGPVLEREADFFGPVVNMASRIVNIAFPGSVIVDASVHDVVADDPDLAWRYLRQRRLKDIGRVPLWAVRRADEGFTERSARDRARSRARADRHPSIDDDSPPVELP